MLKSIRTLRKWGANWEWVDEDNIRRGHWKSTSGNLVLIFPPDVQYKDWLVSVCDEEVHKIQGGDAEERAFSDGEAYTRQDRTMTDQDKEGL